MAQRGTGRGVTTTSDALPVPVAGATADPEPRFTPREREVLALIAAGMSNQEIAAHLFLSVNSVKTHVRSAYRKIGVSRRVDAVRWVLMGGRATTSGAVPEAAPGAGVDPSS